MESVPEIQLNQENLTFEESVLSPAKELEYRAALAAANAENADLTEKVTVLTEDITDLHQQIAMYKKHCTVRRAKRQRPYSKMQYS